MTEGKQERADSKGKCNPRVGIRYEYLTYRQYLIFLFIRYRLLAIMCETVSSFAISHLDSFTKSLSFLD